MSSQVYFGTADKQTWIKSPASGMKASSVGWATQSQLLDGRAFVRRSNGTHRQYDASWLGSMNNTDLSLSLHTIKDFADGLYGDGPYYFIDPYAAKTNLMPPHWAAPMLAEKGWLELATDVTPTYTAASVANNFPSKYAEYVTTDDYESTEKLTLIIPTGSVSDLSNVPYDRMTFTNIKAIGVQWIYKYTLATAKEMLGLVRGKYTTVPIPGAETTLNGADLVAQGREDKVALILELTTLLQSMTRQGQMEQEAAIATAMSSQLNKVPLFIYIK